MLSSRTLVFFARAAAVAAVQKPLSRAAVAAAALIISGNVPAAAQQQDFPKRPVRIVVPYAAGGGTDINARNVAPRLAERWAQPVVVDNRAGGNAIIGTDIVAKAVPVGHTILLSASSEIATNVSLFAKIPYDPVRDLQPVTLASSTPVIIVAHPSIQVRSVTELVAAARTRSLAYSSVGTGSPQHLVGEWLKSVSRIELTHIPYKGAGPALIDNLAGHVPLGFQALLPAVPHVKAGRLHGLAVTGAARSMTLADVPTLKEVGYPNIELVQWYGVFVPAGTPRFIVEKINRDFNAVLNLPEVRERLTSSGADVIADTTPEQFGRFVRAEIDKNRHVVRIAGVKGE
jgi:tripartite-type tricarboxylate transporter receptor subunit TctC